MFCEFKFTFSCWHFYFLLVGFFPSINQKQKVHIQSMRRTLRQNISVALVMKELKPMRHFLVLELLSIMIYMGDSKLFNFIYLATTLELASTR